MTPRILPGLATVLTAAFKIRGVNSFRFHHPRAAFAGIKSGVFVANNRVLNFLSIGFRKMSSTTVNAQMSFVDFLETTPANLSQRLEQINTNDYAATNSIHLVMGNEAGDADSIVSALSLAYVNTLSVGKGSHALNVPLVSVPRADLPLRRDAVLLLDMAGINTNDLLYMDDEIVNNLLTGSAELSITLVDHNRIRSSLSHLSDKVSTIIDHHEDELSHDHVTIDSGNRLIAFDKGLATVASTCTLVAERLLQATGPSGRIDRGLGLVLLGVILLDSVNMLPEAGKGTERDEAAIQNLLKQTDWTTCTHTTPALVDNETMKKIFSNGVDNMPDRTVLFDTLSGAKFDPKFWHDMSARDCLRIDYKRFPVPSQSSVQSIGISTVLMDMNSVIEKKDFSQIVADFVEAENVDIFGVMTMAANDDGTFERELLMAGRDVGLIESFAKHLLNNPDAAFLEITERENKSCFDGEMNSGLQIRLFRQGNVKGSRKQVAPVLLSFASTVTDLSFNTSTI